MAKKALKNRQLGWKTEKTPDSVITGTFSLYFDVVGKYWEGGPDEIKAAPLNRICTLARKMGLETVIVEDALARKEIAREIDALWRQSRRRGIVKAASISFLRAPPPVGGTEAEARQIIGQVTIITYPTAKGQKSFVFEAILRVPARWENGEEIAFVNRCVPKAQTFDLTVRGITHSVVAAYYCQENGATRNIAQSAVRIAVRSIEGTPFDAEEKFTKIDLQSRNTADVIVTALRKRGIGSHLYAIDDETSADEIWTAICSFIESGNPALLVMSRKGETDRVIPILGYTLNTDEWHPGATVLEGRRKSIWHSSSQWIDHLVVHDSLLGPYFCLSRAWLSESMSKGRKKRMRPALVIAPIWTKQVSVSPVFAEQLAGQYLDVWMRRVAEASPGTGRWWEYLVRNGNFVVLRTTFISKRDYIVHLQRLDESVQKQAPGEATWISTNGRPADSFDRFIASLPEYFWMSEISLPQLYIGNRTKLGEVLIDCNQRNLQGFLGIRLPSRAVWRDGRGNFSLAATGLESHGALLDAVAGLTVS